MTASLIAAVSENDVIGCKGNVPWHIPEDLARVKRLTMGHHLIMGRITFEIIGRALPGRTSIVLSRQKNYAGCGEPGSGRCLVVHSLDAALSAAREADEAEAFIFGGAQLYRQALPRAARIYLTRVHHHFEGDAFFPVPGPEWHEVSREDRALARPFPYSFIVLEKNR